MLLPYVDNATFAMAPTGVDITNIVPQGTTAAQSAELTRVLERASAWVDNVCQQHLGASIDSEQQRLRPNRDGQIELFTKNFPIVQLLTAQYMDTSAFSTSSWQTINTSAVQLLEKSILIFDRNYSWWRAWGARPLLVQYEYSNGYAHTQLTAPATAGSSTVTVASTIGVGTLAAGSAAWNLSTGLEILDGASGETVQVQSIAGNVLTLTAPLAHDHAAGALVSAIPHDVQQTTIDFAAYLIKTRGVGGLEMADRSVSGRELGKGFGADAGLDEAKKRLISYTRVGAA